MNILDRYIARSVALSLGLVLLVLVALFLLFTFIDEVDQIGKGRYGTLEALLFVCLLIPRRIYEFFPMAALLGTLIGLGILANHGELTVMRAAGLSILRIFWAVMKLGILLMIVVVVLGESIAPRSEQYARNMRTAAQSEQAALHTGGGLWARDGDHFIHIRGIQPGGQLQGLSLYELDDQHRLQALTTADAAQYYQGDQQEWVLENLARTQLYQDGSSRVEQMTWDNWDSLLNPHLIRVLILEPARLSVTELSQYIAYLRTNNLAAAPYELAFWQRLVYPLATAVMIFPAVPFVFGSIRSVSMGRRVFTGALLGISFYALNQATGQVALLYDFSPILSALLPPLLLLGFGLILTARII